jgi:hypothetical protein
MQKTKIIACTVWLQILDFPQKEQEKAKTVTRHGEEKSRKRRNALVQRSVAPRDNNVVRHEY